MHTSVTLFHVYLHFEARYLPTDSFVTLDAAIVCVLVAGDGIAAPVRSQTVADHATAPNSAETNHSLTK